MKRENLLKFFSVLQLIIAILIIIGYICNLFFYFCNYNIISQKTNTSPYSSSISNDLRIGATEKMMLKKNNTRAYIHKIGDKGDIIKDIQQRLIKYGYNLDPDSIYGKQTYNAVLDFQTRLNLAKTGEVNPETYAKLNEEPTNATRYKPPAPSVSASSATSPDKASLESFVNTNGLESNTPYLIWIDLGNQKVNLFTGKYQSWELIKSISCSSGKPSTPTVKGSFTIESKGSYFRVSSDVICKYYSQFYGNYLMHSVLLDNEGNIVDGTLGTPVSHGCVRLPIEDAKYIYDYIPIGTKVFIK